MHEAMLTKKKSGAQLVYGLDIQNFDGVSYTKSAGVTERTVNGKTVFDFALGAVNWLRIPYLNTPSIVAEDVDIHVYFNVRSITSTTIRLPLISRYKQSSDPPSFQIYMQKSGVLQVGYNNQLVSTTGVVLYNTDYDLHLERHGDVYTLSLNDVVIWTMTKAGVFVSTWDWLFGTYLTSANAPILATYASPADWTLYGCTMKKL